MHCGYIGLGDAFGGLSGRNFAPHRRPIKSLNAPSQVDGGEGVLLIIKNYPAIFLTLKQRPSYSTIAA
ncbi:hypothetical protein ACVXHB_03480 [Escherichia coli]